jgi:DNA repair protein RecO (recombination protein O)
MYERSTGLVLRTRVFTETSLIVQWLSADFGRIATVARGARRPKSPFRGKLDLFFLADFTFRRSRTSDLHTLQEVSLRTTYPTLRESLHSLEQASYAALLVEAVTEKETPLPDHFQLMLQFLENQSTQEDPRLGLLGFEIKLLRTSGLAPDLRQSRLTEGSKQLLEQFQKLAWPELSRLRPSEAQWREIKAFVHGFLIHHIGKLPHGRERAWRESSS